MAASVSESSNSSAVNCSCLNLPTGNSSSRPKPPRTTPRSVSTRTSINSAKSALHGTSSPQPGRWIPAQRRISRRSRNAITSSPASILRSGRREAETFPQFGGGSATAGQRPSLERHPSHESSESCCAELHLVPSGFRQSSGKPPGNRKENYTSWQKKLNHPADSVGSSPGSASAL